MQPAFDFKDITFLLIKDINIFRVDIPFNVDAMMGNNMIRYELVFTRVFNGVYPVQDRGYDHDFSDFSQFIR